VFSSPDSAEVKDLKMEMGGEVHDEDAMDRSWGSVPVTAPIQSASATLNESEVLAIQVRQSCS
jgi:hypothetical protein